MMSQDKEDGNKIKTSAIRRRLLVIAMVGILAAAFSAVWLAGTANAQEAAQSTIVRDSVLLVGPRTIAAGDFIHVYDAVPYHIMKGHIALKIPCDNESNPSLQVLIGQAPHLVPANLTLVAELSTPGQQCLYHLNVESHVDPNNPLITDVAIKSSGDMDVQLTDTSTVFVGVDEIMPNPPAGGGGSSMNMTEGGSMQGMEG